MITLVHLSTKFSSKQVADELIIDLLKNTLTTKPTFGLSPESFILIRNADLKKLLHHICLKDANILEAPITIAILANTECWKTATTKPGNPLASTIEHTFNLGILDLMGIIKKIIHPVLHLAHPTPEPLTSKRDISNFLKQISWQTTSKLANLARERGLYSHIIARFDEERAKQLLKIPKHVDITNFICLGFPLDEADFEEQPVSNENLLDKLCIDVFGNRPITDNKH
jgi:nitroreductase